ncbi:MAG: flagellar basal body-associated FliL family protein [Acidimicrobiales bacterium]
MAKDKGKKDEGDDEEESGGGKKKIIMIVGALVLLGGVYKFVLAKPAEPASSLTPEELAAMMTPEEKAALLDPPEGEILQMEEMILNLAGPDETYLKIRLALVLDTLTVAEEFQLELPIAQDVAVQYLSSLEPDEFRSAEGREHVKQELTTRLKEAYHDEHVLRVLITELVMQ